VFGIWLCVVSTSFDLLFSTDDKSGHINVNIYCCSPRGQKSRNMGG